MYTRIISVAEAFPVYFCPDNWELNRIDSRTFRKFVEVHLDEGFHFLGTFSEGVLMGVTAFRGNNTLEVHTYIDKPYRKFAVEIHKQHVKYFKDIGKHGLITQVSERNRASMNYLCKRVGFVLNPEPYSSVTVDGEKRLVYRLAYVLSRTSSEDGASCSVRNH